MKIKFLSHLRSSQISCWKIIIYKSGLGLIEYALIIALVSLVCIVGMSSLSQQGINPTLQATSDSLEQAST